MAEVAERSTVEILRAARERITPAEAWSEGAFARNSDGLYVSLFDPRASSWCATATLLVELGVECEDYYRGLASSEAWALLKLAAPHSTPEAVNDAGGHASVLALYDAAIQLAELEPTNG